MLQSAQSVLWKVICLLTVLTRYVTRQQFIIGTGLWYRWSLTLCRSGWILSVYQVDDRQQTMREWAVCSCQRGHTSDVVLICVWQNKHRCVIMHGPMLQRPEHHPWKLKPHSSLQPPYSPDDNVFHFLPVSTKLRERTNVPEATEINSTKEMCHSAWGNVGHTHLWPLVMWGPHFMSN